MVERFKRRTRFARKVAAECWRRAIASPEGQLFLGFGIVCAACGVAFVIMEHLERTVSPEAATEFSMVCLTGVGVLIVLILGLVALDKIRLIVEEIKGRKE